jgi:hypothetical protein
VECKTGRSLSERAIRFNPACTWKADRHRRLSACCLVIAIKTRQTAQAEPPMLGLPPIDQEIPSFSGN